MKRDRSTNNEIGDFLRWFTKEEDALKERIRGVKLPERLDNWRMWIGDATIYLNELKAFVEDYESTDNE